MTPTRSRWRRCARTRNNAGPSGSFSLLLLLFALVGQPAQVRCLTRFGASVDDVRLRKVLTLEKQGDAIGLRAGVDEAVSEIEVCGMPDDPPKAGGGFERAPADVGADQHFLDIVGCEERHDDGMRGADLFACPDQLLRRRFSEGGRNSGSFCTR